MGDGSDPGVWDEAAEDSSVCGNPDQPWQRPNSHYAPHTHDGRRDPNSVFDGTSHIQRGRKTAVSCRSASSASRKHITSIRLAYFFLPYNLPGIQMFYPNVTDARTCSFTRFKSERDANWTPNRCDWWLPHLKQRQATRTPLRRTSGSKGSEDQATFLWAERWLLTTLIIVLPFYLLYQNNGVYTPTFGFLGECEVKQRFIALPSCPISPDLRPTLQPCLDVVTAAFV